MSTSYGDRNKEFWDDRAAQTDFFSAGSPIDKSDPSSAIRQRYRNRTEFKHIKNVIDLKGKRLIDLGCGTGRLSFKFAKYCKEVYGFDFSSEMIRQAREHAEQTGVKNVHFEVGDITKFKFDKKFDIVFFGGVLMCIQDEDLDAVLQGILPLLHKDSTVINRDTLSLNEAFTTEIIPHRPDFSKYRTKEEYIQLFSSDYETFYVRETYPLVVGVNLYRRLPKSMRKWKVILWLLDFSLWIQSEFLDPFLLKNPGLYKKQFEKWKKSDYGRRQFFFFHKRKDV